MKTFRTREELLQDSINYYWGNPDRLNMNSLGTCKYSAVGKSDGCAIGRHLDPYLAMELDQVELPMVYELEVFEQLPNWMKDLGRKFLSNLQRLHDNRYFTDKDKEEVCRYMKPYVDLDQIKFPD